MNREFLEECVLTKKKNSLSFSKKREFWMELEEALKDEGITENTEKYIFSCGSLGSGISFFNYIRNMDELQINEYYTLLVNTKGFQENANMNSARVLLTLIIMAMGEDKKFLYMTADSIKRVPDLLLTKDGKIAANANKIIIFNFFEYVDFYKKWYTMSELGLSDNEWRKFILLINNAMGEFKPKKENQRYAYKNLDEWLKREMKIWDETSTGNSDTETIDNIIVSSDEYTSTEQKKEEQLGVNTGENQCLKDKNPGNTSKKKSSAAEKLIEFASYVEIIETENDKMKAELRVEKRKNNNLQSLYEKTKKNVEEKEEEITRLMKSIKEARNQVAEKDKVIEELELSIQKQNDVYSIYSSDTESRHIEKMNAIAARLKGEYKDFLESQSMDMTIDLGLNLRDQLEDVFNILMKNGIDIKGR